MRTVCEWKFDRDDNMLHALLYYNYDELSLEYMGYFNKFLQKELYLYALEHSNHEFMKGALLAGAFPKSIFMAESVIMQMLVYLEDGSKTNYLLNVLLLSEVTLWKNRFLQELIEIIDNFASEPYETNRLLLSYNPIMSIALTADLLTKIAVSRRRYTDQCLNLKNDILSLGKVFNAKIEDENFYKRLIEDADFTNRTVLNIICN